MAREVEKKERERKGRILRDKKEKKRERERETLCAKKWNRWRHVVM